MKEKDITQERALWNLKTNADKSKQAMQKQLNVELESSRQRLFDAYMHAVQKPETSNVLDLGDELSAALGPEDWTLWLYHHQCVCHPQFTLAQPS